MNNHHGEIKFRPI